MKKSLLFSFLSLLIVFLLLRWQGAVLITPASPRGILDLEFARTASHLSELKLFWNDVDLTRNIYLDFLFIGSYVWFLVTACRYLGRRREKWGRVFSGVAIAAGVFDVIENCLLLFIWERTMAPGWLEIVYFIALIKFILAGITVLYLLFSLPLFFITNAPDRRN